MYTVGIDEAGRGALAGPVVVAAVAIPRGVRIRAGNLPKLQDSKKMTARARAAWYEHIVAHPQISFSSARVYQRRIDKINIARSANVAASRALDRVLEQVETPFEVLLDGGLYLAFDRHKDVDSQTIVRGDNLRVAIKLASVVAKVRRDRYLEMLDKRYPGYNLGKHKGYGTRGHFEAIDNKGILEIHRLTYLGRYNNLKSVN